MRPPPYKCFGGHATVWIKTFRNKNNVYEPIKGLVCSSTACSSRSISFWWAGCNWLSDGWRRVHRRTWTQNHGWTRQLLTALTAVKQGLLAPLVLIRTSSTMQGNGARLLGNQRNRFQQCHSEVKPQGRLMIVYVGWCIFGPRVSQGFTRSFHTINPANMVWFSWFQAVSNQILPKRALPLTVRNWSNTFYSTKYCSNIRFRPIYRYTWYEYIDLTLARAHTSFER